MRFRRTVERLALALGSSLTLVAWSADLEGTAWRLLNIASMNDSVATPNDPDKYTLEFAADGRVVLRADCKRGTGSWKVLSASQLEFGPIAATGAMCSPGSLSDRFLAQFQWVRSYTMEDGHLFLATMADGSIIEFEPLPPVVATLLGEEIRADSSVELQRTLLGGLLDHYASDQGIEVSEAEVDACVERLRRGMAEEGLDASDELKPEEQVQYTAMQREMARALIRQWKINKSLYEAYGGRIIYQQLGPEPLDAFRKYLEERREAGDFSITDPEMAVLFWRYFTDDSSHDFMQPGSEELERVFTVPPWK